MMREASDVAGDEVILPNYTLADLDEVSIRRYRQRFQTRPPVLCTTISMMPGFWEGSGHFAGTTKRDSPG